MTGTEQAPTKQNNEKSEAVTDNKPRKLSARCYTSSEVNHSIYDHTSQSFSLSSRVSFWFPPVDSIHTHDRLFQLTPFQGDASSSESGTFSMGDLSHFPHFPLEGRMECGSTCTRSQEALWGLENPYSSGVSGVPARRTIHQFPRNSHRGITETSPFPCPANSGSFRDSVRLVGLKDGLRDARSCQRLTEYLHETERKQQIWRLTAHSLFGQHRFQ
jgi:hypothetical protein